jgi:hypothetical protein
MPLAGSILLKYETAVGRRRGFIRDDKAVAHKRQAKITVVV